MSEGKADNEMSEGVQRDETRQDAKRRNYDDTTVAFAGL